MSVRPFHRRSDLELAEAGDEALVDYLVAAREAGDAQETAMALQLLVFGRMRFVESMVARKVPDHAVDRVAGEAMFSVMKTMFDGESVGQFVNLLRRVTERRSGVKRRRSTTTRSGAPPSTSPRRSREC